MSTTEVGMDYEDDDLDPMSDEWEAAEYENEAGDR